MKSEPIDIITMKCHKNYKNFSKGDSMTSILYKCMHA